MERLVRSAGTPPGTTAPVVMLNLLRHREVADYSATPELDPGTPCSGREAYGRYSEAVLPLLAGLGGGIEMFGPCHGTLIGPEHEERHDIVLARYTSVAAFVGMVTSPEYGAIAGHRLAALADSRLVPTGAARP